MRPTTKLHEIILKSPPQADRLYGASEWSPNHFYAY